MNIEFILKDRNGISLNEGDAVEYCCDNIIEKDCGILGQKNGARRCETVMQGKLLFYRTKEQVAGWYKNTKEYNNIQSSYCPSDSATLELMFVSDKGDITWSIKCPSETEDYRHPKLTRLRD